VVILLFYAVGAVLELLQKGGTARILGVFLLTLLLLVAPVAAMSFDSLLAFMGKDSTLTGRTDIWGYVIPYIYQRPWLGWGYAAFWSTLNPAAWEIANALRWYSPEAHNGLLEILLSGGLVGVVWFAYLLVRTVRLSLRCMRYDSAMAITCLSCCAGILVEGVDEQVLLYVMGLSGVFFITGFFCEQAVSRAPRRRPVALGNVVRAQSARVTPSSATAKFWPRETRNVRSDQVSGRGEGFPFRHSLLVRASKKVLLCESGLTAVLFATVSLLLAVDFKSAATSSFAMGVDRLTLGRQTGAVYGSWIKDRRVW
jgi:O-Antigen ligase